MAFMERINSSTMGGLSWASQRYAKPDPGQRIAYFGFTSLYPSVTRLPLPCGDYQRVEATLTKALHLISVNKPNQETGYLMVVDF